MSKVKIPTYSLGEEIFNSTSHGIGAGLSIAALVLLVIKANNPLDIVSCSIYGTCLIVLYTMSCIYHGLSNNLKGKKVLRVIDHCNVMLLEFGTYVPLCLSALNNKVGWIMFSITLSVTIISIVFNAIDVDKYTKLSLACNLIEGWVALIIFNPLIKAIGKNGVILLILGGLIYSIGAILYVIGSKKKWMHSIFHIFCLLGSIVHFFMIYFYVI